MRKPNYKREILILQLLFAMTTIYKIITLSSNGSKKFSCAIFLKCEITLERKTFNLLEARRFSTFKEYYNRKLSGTVLCNITIVFLSRIGVSRYHMSSSHPFHDSPLSLQNLAQIDTVWFAMYSVV